MVKGDIRPHSVFYDQPLERDKKVTGYDYEKRGHEGESELPIGRTPPFPTVIPRCSFLKKLIPKQMKQLKCLSFWGVRSLLYSVSGLHNLLPYIRRDQLQQGCGLNRVYSEKNVRN